MLKAAAFGMRIFIISVSAARYRRARAADECAPLDRLLAESDWVVPQLPYTPQTHHFINRERLAHMKPGAFLVNISRANVIDRDALIEALRSGHLGGFALDPLYELPGRGDDELLSFPNVVLTPHIAAQPRSNFLRIWSICWST